MLAAATTEMTQADRDAIRRFVNQWKREVAADEKRHQLQEQEERGKNERTWLIAVSVLSFSGVALLIVLLISAFFK